MLAFWLIAGSLILVQHSFHEMNNEEAEYGSLKSDKQSRKRQATATVDTGAVKKNVVEEHVSVIPSPKHAEICVVLGGRFRSTC